MSETTASAKAKAKAKTEDTKQRRTASPKTSETAKASLNLQELRELAELVNEHGFTDFEFENENIRVRLSKATAAPVMQAFQPAPAPLASQTVSVNNAESVSVESNAAAAEEELHKITSPIVGTFYRSPSPDKDPYIKEGDKVSDNTTVCIVEAMKLMNEIQAEVTGEVVKIYVENGQPVEYGQPLFGIRK